MKVAELSVAVGMGALLALMVAGGCGDAEPSVDTRRPADVPADSTGPESVVQIVRMDSPSKFTVEITSIERDGKMRVATADQRSYDPAYGARSHFGAGRFLGLVVPKPSRHRVPDRAELIHIDVKSIFPDGTAVGEVGVDAASKLSRGDVICLYRPANFGDADWEQLPDYAVVTNDGSARSSESGESESDQHLAQSRANLTLIAKAMQDYRDTTRRFPPAVTFGPDGKPWHSWRVLLLPFLGDNELWRLYKHDEPWDGPHNRTLLDRMPAVYRDPVHGDEKGHFTHYAAVVGKDAMFRRDVPRPGASHRETKVRIQDPFSDTLAIGTVGPAQNIPWTKPADVVIDEPFERLGDQGIFSTPFPTSDPQVRAGLFLFADGTVRAIRDDVEPQRFYELVTVEGREEVDWDSIPSLDLAEDHDSPDRIAAIEIKWQNGQIDGTRYVKVTQDEMDAAQAEITAAKAAQADTPEDAATREQAVATYRLVPLGSPADYDAFGAAKDVNNNRQIIGYAGKLNPRSIAGRSKRSIGILWQEGQPTPLDQQRDSFTATCISDEGTVVGFVTHDAGRCTAALWKDGAFTLMGHVPGGQDYSHAQAITADGNVVYGSGPAAKGSRMFRWTDGRFELLADLPEGFDNVTPFDVNSSGDVAGISDGRFTTAADRSLRIVRAWLYDNGRFTMLAVPELSAVKDVERVKLRDPVPSALGHPYVSTRCQAVNAGRQVAGSASCGPQQMAVRWDGPDKVTVLADLPGGREYAAALDINHRGVVVGWGSGEPSTSSTKARTGHPGARATLWKLDGTPVDLNRLVDDSAEGWLLVRATAINDHGDIVGEGLDPSGRRWAFLLVAK